MYDFKQVEQEVQKFWKNSINNLNKTIEYNSKKKIFSFLEGPPTANAPPALHHVEMRTMKDLFCKYKFMSGFTVPRKGGWDCHGLPVEVQIEKKLGLNSKKDILNYGVKKFIEECRNSVFSYIKEWEVNTEKLNYLIDLNNPYRTLDNSYIESIWWSLKELYNKKLLYEGRKVVPYCPRCETPLSSHEVSQGYKDVTDPTAVVELKLKDEDSYVLAWTTTPWTLPSNLALAVNPEIIYAKVKHNNKTYILAKDLVSKYFNDAKIMVEIKGKELIGKSYIPLFDYFTAKFSDTKAWTIIGGDFVKTDEGTGVVHMAPAFGEDDYLACEKNNIPFIQPVTETGKFTEEVTDFKDLFVKHADKKIIAYLEEKGKLFKTERYLHSYPYCWRCDTPLIYYTTDSWFVKVTAIKDKLLKNNKKISWYPSHIKEGRFGNWLEGARDWALSRKKFWGTPLPIWRSKEGDEICIGSIKELEKLSGRKIKDLHKPEVDNIIIKKNNKEYKRVEDVIDCWYDSGSASFAQLHYPFENKTYFEKRFPYDFVSEAIDQTRGWFYTLHVLATALFDKPAFKSVVCAGHIVDEKGEKMSKSKGNVLIPNEIFDSVGIDATRLQMFMTSPGDQKRFSVHLVNESVLPFLNILFNTHKFTKDMTELTSKKPSMLPIEDRWIISKTNNLIRDITEELENHNYHQCLKKFVQFVNEDVSRWYIKLIRDRASVEDPSLGYVFNEIFSILTKLLAPFAPYISEYINMSTSKKSIHLEAWPKHNPKEINKKLEDSMEIAKEITSKILSEREQNKIGVRWPLSMATVWAPKALHKGIKEFEHIIKSQCNIKEIEIKDSKEEITAKLNTKITKELEQEGFYREISRKIQALRKKANLVKADEISVVIDSDYDISKFKDELKEKVGAVNLDFGELSGKYDVTSEEKVRDKIFKIAFNKL
ncbi:MAG: isoleucine--tRNA ligase [Nanoarchaeota archaeon]|nr:isoleucine--tRNA ligase [Nanoarchaeota archaeon]